jgi:hypothetical protein
LSFEITDEPEVLKRDKEVRGIAWLVANARGGGVSRDWTSSENQRVGDRFTACCHKTFHEHNEALDG